MLHGASDLMTIVEVSREASLMLVRALAQCERTRVGEAAVTSPFTVGIQLVGKTEMNDRKMCVCPSEEEDSG